LSDRSLHIFRHHIPQVAKEAWFGDEYQTGELMGGARVIEEIAHLTIKVLESSLLWGFLG
jgi:hypothetical protein